MNRLYLLSWYYQGQDGESSARNFFGKLRAGIENGKKFPFDCPSEVGLVHCKVDEHWCVGVLTMRGTESDDSIEQTNELHKWFEACGADFSGTDKTGERATHSSIQEILQNRYGSHYTCVEVFDPLSRVPGDKDGCIESKNLSLDNLNPEDKAIATELIGLGDDDPDVRYEAYNVLEQKRYQDEVLLSGISRIEAGIPSSDVETRARLYSGLGTWLGGNRYTRPKGMELIRHAIELSPNLALSHAMLGTLLMGDSSNSYLERGTGSFRQHPELSDGELESLSKNLHNQAQEELELAIRLNPNDPTPYYVFCNSQFVDYPTLKNQYLQAVQRDETRSPEFGGKHWSFAVKAAKFDQAGDATEAFLRAMLVAPEKYYEGTGSVRPKEGLALSCWHTAKQEMVSYRDDPGRLAELWQAGKDVENVPLSQPAKVAAQTPAAPSPVPDAVPAMPAVKATPGFGQEKTSPALNAVIQKYLSREYTLVSRTDTSAILKRQSPINWGIFIFLLIVFRIGAIIYLLARKKYQVTLVEQPDGGVLETGGTLEEFEADRARDTSRPKSAFYMIVFGVLLTVVGGFFGLILLLSHLSDPVLSKDPMATITAMLICPTPIVVIGLLMLAGGLFIRRRAEHAPGMVEQTAQAASPRPTPQPTVMEQQAQVPASELVMAPVESEEVSTPHQAFQSITNPGESDLTELLNTLVNSQDRNARHKAAASLEEQGWQPDNSEAGAAYWLANPFNTQKWEKCVEIGAPAVRPLLAELKDGTTWTDKACAAEALSKITPRLENEEARQLVLETFLKEITDASRFTNAATLFSGNMADLWNNDKLRVYIAAAQALGELADEQAVQPLIAGLESKQAPRLHDAILEALVKIGEPSVEPLLTALKSSENDDVRKEAAEALKQLGWTSDKVDKADDKVDQQRPGPAVTRILHDLEDPDMTARLTTIGQAGVLLVKNEPGALEPFLVILRDKEQLVRMTALALLWKFDKNILHTALRASGKANAFRSILTELANGDSLEADDAKRVLANISE
jgi:tetratricopeptide (TPR) repeat protein